MKRGIPRSAETKKKIRQSIIRDLQTKIAHQIHPNYNKEACQLFDNINREFGWCGWHAENGGEFYLKELGYWVDYYEPTQNVVIEYDELKHVYTRDKDQYRQREIEQYLGCLFIRISEFTKNQYICILRDALVTYQPTIPTVCVERTFRYPRVTDPTGIIYQPLNLTQFCKEHNLIQQSMSKVINGQLNHHRMWRICV